jgi:hypothetical protein
VGRDSFLWYNIPHLGNEFNFPAGKARGKSLTYVIMNASPPFIGKSKMLCVFCKSFPQFRIECFSVLLLLVPRQIR